MRGDAPEPLIFTAWLREAVRAIYSDDLGPAAFDRFFDTRATTMIRLLEGRATGRDWCDDRTTPEREKLRRHAGPRARTARWQTWKSATATTAAKWRWDTAHYADGEHRPFGAVCRGWRPISTSRCRAPAAPTRSTAARRTSARSRRSPTGTARAFAPSMTSPTSSARCYMQSTGQSGNPMSPFYRSFAKRWAKGEYIEIPTRRETIDRSAIGTWKLSPR